MQFAHWASEKTADYGLQKWEQQVSLGGGMRHRGGLSGWRFVRDVNKGRPGVRSEAAVETVIKSRRSVSVRSGTAVRVEPQESVQPTEENGWRSKGKALAMTQVLWAAG